MSKQVTKQEAIEILTFHNKWRRGDDTNPMQNPTLLGIAIDKILKDSEPVEYQVTYLQDTYDCETCGSSYADGYEIRKNGELVYTMKPVAHCYGGDNYTQDELVEWIVNDLGAKIAINY